MTLTLDAVPPISSSSVALTVAVYLEGTHGSFFALLSQMRAYTVFDMILILALVVGC